MKSDLPEEIAAWLIVIAVLAFVVGYFAGVGPLLLVRIIGGGQ